VSTDDCAAAPSQSPLSSAVSLPISTASFGNNASSVALSGAVSANQSVGLELSLTNLQLGFTNLQGTHPKSPPNLKNELCLRT
jgi:hypothetical protein